MASRSPWEHSLDRTLYVLSQSSALRSLRPLFPIPPPHPDSTHHTPDFQTFPGIGPWDRSAVEIEISPETLDRLLHGIPSSGDEVDSSDLTPSGSNAQRGRKMVLFSGNDYLGLSTHPTVRRAASKAALEFGMGPRGSALMCGYTYHHRLLESTLAEMHKTEDCLLCPTGFAASMAVMTAIASVVSHCTDVGKEDVTAMFSDALNHASIIDGINLARRQSKIKLKRYRHCDISHLNELLSSCNHERKVVITDSLFSMDGDCAPLVDLVALRKKHGFLLVIDDAHGTLVYGKTGGGVAEAFNVEDEIDISIGSLSKAVGCQGGFVVCSKKWKQLIQSTGRSFIFSTALPVPVVAAAHAAILVAQEEKWRQQALWERVHQFAKEIGLEFTSPIVPVILGSTENALKASRSMLLAGFHVLAVMPPVVPDHFSRLRITLSAGHTVDDVKNLASAVIPWIQNKPPSVSLVSFEGSSEGIEDHLKELSSEALLQEERITNRSKHMLSSRQLFTKDVRAKL